MSSGERTGARLEEKCLTVWRALRRFLFGFFETLLGLLCCLAVIANERKRKEGRRRRTVAERGRHGVVRWRKMEMEAIGMWWLVVALREREREVRAWVEGEIVERES